MINDDKDVINSFAKIGEKDCESNCERDFIHTEDKIYIVCNFCKRIVMERDKK